MSQSYVSIGSFPVEVSRPSEWVCPKPAFRERLQACTRYLRYPSAEDGLGYYLVRIAWIAVLKISLSHLWWKTEADQ